ncbi:MAG: DUF6641 family protein [Fluviibacter phosphoraccumulans]
MSTLNNLKLTNAKRPQAMSAVVIRRHKLMKKLHEQQMLAEAIAAGKTYTATRLKNVVDTDTGLTKTIEVPRRVRAWWWTGEDGKICLNVKYGSSCLQIAKGKFAIEAGSIEGVIEALQTLKRATEAGELDGQIEAVAGEVKSGFGR